MAGARSRWKGAQAELRDLLCPLVTTRSFVRYDESEQQNKTVTDPKLTGEHHTLLGVLHGAQPNPMHPWRYYYHSNNSNYTRHFS